MFALDEIADTLGMAVKDTADMTPIGLIARIESGLPLKALTHLVSLVAPADAQFKYRLIPKATYERRKAARRISAEEGAVLARVARVWGAARDVWGDNEAARGFLFRSHMMLEDQAPIDVVLRSEFGAEMVLDILGGLKYGTAA